VKIGKELPGKSYVLTGNWSAASQAKSNNTLRITSKPQNGLYEFLRWVMMAPYLALWCNSYTYVTIWHFWSLWSTCWLSETTRLAESWAFERVCSAYRTREIPMESHVRSGCIYANHLNFGCKSVNKTSSVASPKIGGGQRCVFRS